jgi:DNA-binding transcriptional ArsR family regulator
MATRQSQVKGDGEQGGKGGRPAHPGEAPKLTEQQLIKAMQHPTRVHAVSVLRDRVSCAAELGRELGQTAKHVSYHLHKLEKLGIIEYVETRSVYGGRTQAHFYRAIVRPWFDMEGWKQVAAKHQPDITSNILSLCNADLAAAVTSGTIHAEDNHISRTPMVLDRDGYSELVEYLDDALEHIIDIHQRAAGRITKESDIVVTKVHIVQFESPTQEAPPEEVAEAEERGSRRRRKRSNATASAA